MNNNADSKLATLFYSLQPFQYILIIVLGIVFWFAAATAVRIGSPLGMFGQISSIISFAIGLPAGWLSAFVIVKIVRLEAHQIIPSMNIGLAVATFCDGIAITWAPWLYGNDPALIAMGAAWILWGVFTFSVGGYIETYRLGLSKK